MMDALPCCHLYSLDCLEYQRVWQWQRSLLNARLDNPALDDVLLLLEHPPVYTLGTGSTLDHLKFDPHHSPAALHRTERGGEVTYHCPGQLVGYPILNLRRHQPDLHWYLRQLEAVVIQTLAAFGVEGERVPGLTGVWVEGVKVAAIGIKVKRWMTMHGFALNVCPDLAGFEQIVPCGIHDRAVGSLVQFVPEVTMAQVRAEIIRAFEQIFHYRIVPQVGPPAV
jgi:lipoyl(octanoyl) transferase